MMETGTERWQAALALLLGLGLSALPGTLTSMLLPLLMRDLALPLQAVALLFPAYTVGLLLGALPAVALARRFGPRAAFVATLGLVTLSSLALALPFSLWELVALRLFQGMAVAGLLAAGLALVRPGFGAARLRIGFGLAVMAIALGAAVLPVLLGVAFGQLGLPGLLTAGLAVAAAALLIGWDALPRVHPDPQRLDLVGIVLNLACLGLLLAACYVAPFRPWRSLVLLLFGLLVLALWVWQQQGRPFPSLPLDLLARPGIRWAAAAALLGGLVRTAVGTVTPTLFAAGQLPRDSFGVVLPVLAAATVLTAGASGWLPPRPGWRPAVAGALLLAAGAAALVRPWGGVPGVLAALLAFSVGRGLFEPGNALALVGGVPTPRAAAAAGLLVGAGAVGSLLAPLLAAVPVPWGSDAAWGGTLDTKALVLGLAALTALLAAWLSHRAERPMPTG